jgi:ribosomal protein S14
MKLWPFVIAAVPLAIGLFGAVYYLGRHPGGERSDVLNKAAWQRMAVPGALSRAHSFLEHNCAACHTAVKGVEASNCIACHANNESLLQRQPTAFHANVSSCRECHREHQGIEKRPTEMDHLALSRIGFRQMKTDHAPDHTPDGENERVRKDLLAWIGQHQPAGHTSDGQSSLSPQEAVLNCATCHANKDRHFNLFGQDCGQCHGTTKWTIPEFRHPSATSKDCAQCHQAPPSHYMMHFQMVSAKVAQKPDAQVDQCYQCHQTTVWNDIKGTGFYKHH